MIEAVSGMIDMLGVFFELSASLRVGEELTELGEENDVWKSGA